MKKLCILCQKEFDTNLNIKKFCSSSCCNKKNSKNWRRRNREKVRQTQKNWRIANREHFNELIRNSPSTKRRVQWEKEHREIVNAKRRKWAKKNRERLRIRENNWNRNNRIKSYAKTKANRKIKIPHGQLCEICNERLAVDKHHPDYTQPLLVKFLCKKCHNNIYNESL